MARDLGVIDGLVHADIVEALARSRRHQTLEDRGHEIVDMDEIALDRHAVGIAEKRDRAVLAAGLGLLGRRRACPVRPAEQVGAEDGCTS